MPTQTKRAVQSFHEVRAREYLDQGYESRNNVDTLVSSHVLQQVLAMLEGRQEPGRALELGCGPGVLALPLMARGYEYWGMDLCIEMIREGRRRLPAEAHLWVGDAEHLGMREGFFDVVTCAQVLDYLPGDEPTLREIRRVLKPGGVAVLTAVMLPSIAYLVKRGLGLVLKVPSLRRYLRARGRVFYAATRGVSSWSFRRRLQAAGLEVERTAWANLVNIPLNIPLPGPTFGILEKAETFLSRSPLKGLGAIMIVRARKR